MSSPKKEELKAGHAPAGKVTYTFFQLFRKYQRLKKLQITLKL